MLCDELNQQTKKGAIRTAWRMNLGSSTAANWVSFDFNVSYSSQRCAFP